MKKWTKWQRLVAVAFISFLAIGLFDLGSVELSTPPPSVTYGPKLLTTPATLVYPDGFDISQIGVKLRTFDAYATFNPINMSLKILLGNIPSGSKALLVLVPTSFNRSVLNGQVELSTFLSIASLSGDVYNFTRPDLIIPGGTVSLNVTIGIPQAGEYTLMGIVAPPNGPTQIGWTSDTMVSVGPYSDYTQVVSNRLTAQINNSIAAQTRGGSIMEALTWIVLSVAVATIFIEMRRS